MSTYTCPLCLSARPENRPVCKTCTLIEAGMSEAQAASEAAKLLEYWSNTDELTYEEAEEFQVLTSSRHYGTYEFPDTVALAVGEKKSLLRRKKKDPEPGGGVGTVAPAEARSEAGTNPEAVMEAHRAWMSMEENALADHKARQSRTAIDWRFVGLAIGALSVCTIILIFILVVLITGGVS